jgi:hypothetical protein
MQLQNSQSQIQSYFMTGHTLPISLSWCPDPCDPQADLFFYWTLLVIVLMQHPLWQDEFFSYEYAWPFVKCLYRTSSMSLKIFPFAFSTSPLSVQALQSRSCLYYAIWPWQESYTKHHFQQLLYCCVFIHCHRKVLIWCCLAMTTSSCCNILTFSCHITAYTRKHYDGERIMRICIQPLLDLHGFYLCAFGNADDVNLLDIPYRKSQKF